MPPPVLLAVAVNSTLVPAQIAPDGLAVSSTVGVKLGLTVIVIILDVAVVADRQDPPLILISTVTWSLLTRVRLV